MTDNHWAVRNAALEELVRGWKDDPDTVRLLKDRAANDPDKYVKYVAVQELTRGWKDDPNIVAWLKNNTATNRSMDGPTE